MQTNLLTPGEKRVVKLVALGFTNPQIVDRMNINRRTVERYITSINQALGFTDGLQGSARGKIARWYEQRRRARPGAALPECPGHRDCNGDLNFCGTKISWEDEDAP